jgi:ribokinase
VDVLVVNESEAALLSGEREPEVAADALGHGTAAVIVTLGADGALVVEGGRSRRVEPYAVDAVDTTAAGDAFCGGLAAGLAAGMALEAAARLGSAAGAAAATKLGARSSLPTAADLQRLFGVEVR